MATTLDEAKVEQFLYKALGDASATQTVFLCSIGDKLGFFKDLAEKGPSTSEELAKRTKTQERYVREWLGGMATAGYLEYEPTTKRFTLPAEHAPVLAQESGPMFFGGLYHMLPELLPVFPQVVQAFRQGGGVPQAAYSEDLHDGMERFTAGWFENHLTQEWIPAVPAVEEALRKGADVADVGCGRGRALIKLAEAFPKSRFVGYDIFAPNISKAVANAKAAGVSKQIRFEEQDVSKGLPETFDVITTFDVIHDAVDPEGILRVIAQGLRPGGSYLCLDINCSDKLEENIGPLGAMFHGFSVFYCMTTSLANGGAALGTVGLHEKKLTEIGRKAGFGTVRKLPLENPFNNLYELKV